MSAHRRITTLAFAVCLAAVPSFFASAAAPGADYVREKSASPVARAHFAAVPDELEARKVVSAAEILRGSFKKANKYIRRNFDDHVRRKSPAEDAAKIPAGVEVMIKSISITNNDLCEVRFVAQSEKEDER